MNVRNQSERQPALDLAGTKKDPSGRAAALLPNGQVLYVGGQRFFCGVKNCFNEPSAKAEVYTP